MTAEPSAGTGSKYGIWFTIFTVVVVAVASGLGVWQLQRLDWKEALIGELQTRSTGPAQALPDGAFADDAMRYRPYSLKGRLHLDRSLNLLSRPRASQLGRHVVTPLELDSGRVVLLDRGWVPLDWTEPPSPEPRIVEIEALARVGGWHGSDWLRPANDAGENAWLWFDLPSMAAAIDLPNVETALYFSARADQEPGPYPIGGQTPIDLPNDHLQYALTWFGLALTMCAIYIILKYRTAKERRRASE